MSDDSHAKRLAAVLRDAAENDELDEELREECAERADELRDGRKDIVVAGVSAKAAESVRDAVVDAGIKPKAVEIRDAEVDR